MGRNRKVSVEGGNLYEVGESDGRYYVRKVKVGVLTSSTYDIGTARSLDDALALIKAHSGKQIRHVG